MRNYLIEFFKYINMFVTKILKNRIFYIKLFQLSDDDFTKYTNFMDNLYFQKKTFKIIFDLSEASIYDALYCSEQVKYMTDNEENTKIYIDSTAIIVQNSIIQNLLELLVFSIKKPIKPNLITKNINDAYTFLINKND